MKFDAVVYTWDFENVYWDAFVITMHCSHLIKQHCCPILSPAKSAKCMYTLYLCRASIALHNYRLFVHV